MSRAMPYPLVNDWRKGCWVKRPDGKPDRDYVYSGEFCQGRPDKGSGTVRYTLDDLGGPGWVIVKDRRRVRSIVQLGELEWVDYGEVPTGDILRVVASASIWTGERCDMCGFGVVLDAETVCKACERDAADRARIAAVPAPDGDPF